MKAKHIPIWVSTERDKPVRPDRKFRFENTAAGALDATFLDRGVLAHKIDQRAVSAARHAAHLAERTCRAGAFHRVLVRRGKHLHLKIVADRAWQIGHFHTTYGFVKFLRACHILNVDLKPPDWIQIVHAQLSPIAILWRTTSRAADNIN